MPRKVQSNSNIVVTLIIVFGFVVISLAILSKNNESSSSKDNLIIQTQTQTQIPNYPYNNFPKDVLLNPYVAPLRDERYLVPQVEYIPRGAIPINISTNLGAVETPYRQVGLLMPGGKKEGKVFALMGRPLYTNRDKWQYYTMSDQYNSVKLPILKQGKSATSEYGVDKLYNGDTVQVEGYNDIFVISVYDNDTIKYIPYL
jgi:hypothetical protein